MPLYLFVTNHKVPGPAEGLVNAEDEWVAEGLIEQALRCEEDQITLREIKDFEELKSIIAEKGITKFM